MKGKFRKIGLLLLCLQAFSPAFGQAWFPFPGGCTFGYSAQLAGQANRHLFGARMDSVRLEGADSAYYFYRIDRPAFPNEVIIGCTGVQWDPDKAFRTNQDHFWGQKMLAATDGTCRFVFSDLDTFVLRTRAVVGESWSFHPNLIAQVDSIRYAAVLGTMDSLKYISINNGRHIILSRQHGLVLMHNLHDFNLLAGTNMNVDFELWGIHEMGLGRRLPGIAEIYGFSPGDQLGYRDGSIGTSFYANYSRNLYVIHSQTSQHPLTYSATLESDFTEYGSYVLNQYQYSYFPTHNVVLQYDSITYSHIDLLPYAHNPKLGQSLHEYFLTSVEIPVNDSLRIEKNYVYLYTNMQGFYDTCAQAFGVSVSPTTTFAVGKGELRAHYDVSFAYDYHDMICYKQQGDGNPPCTLQGPLGVGAPVAPEVASAMVAFPNPADDHVQFRFPEAFPRRAGQIRVYGATGQICSELQVAVGAEFAEFPTDQLSNGLYWAVYAQGGRQLFCGKFTVQH